MTSPLISGTTSFLVGSMRQCDELSTTRHPTSANFGASSAEVLPPAEKSARSGRAAIASSALTTVHSLPWNVIFLPTDLAEATGRSSVTGKFFSARTSSILVPTNPVAPTTATFIVVYFSVNDRQDLQPFARTGPRSDRERFC